MSINLDGIIYRSVYVTSGLYRMVQKDDFDAMVERIEELELHLASAISERDDYRSRIDAMFWCEACDRLEIERKVDSVSAERAAVVAWLREEYDTHTTQDAADTIERGEHRLLKEGT
jgi:tetrahydromethanopterin S-methyltransferase subunit G